MNQALIRNWNSRVKDEDLVFHLGDFCFKNSSESRGEGQKFRAFDWIQQLNGQKVFIRGNHDKNNSLHVLMTRAYIEYAGIEYELVHRPEDSSQETAVTFCGHVHEKWKYRLFGNTTLINVGVEVNEYMPKTIEELLSEFKHWLRNNKLESLL